MAGRRTTRPALFLSTRFGRGIFALFLSCALLPVALLAGISWTRVSDELRTQSQRRLHAASRSAGMRVIEHLSLVSEALADGDRTRLRTDVRGLAAREADGDWRLLFGDPVPVAALADAERGALERGDPVLQLSEHDDPSVVLLRASRHGRWLAARLREDRLSAVSQKSALPPEAETCVFLPSGRPLRCSFEAAEVRPPPASAERSSPELVPWTLAGVTYLASPWPLFLRAQFHHPRTWLVVVAEPEEVVFAPIASFRVALVWVTVLGLALAALLSVYKIRQRLLPLERLREGTRRISQSDFSPIADVPSGDELGELADSFNAMAHRLERQFRSLERVIENDRAILAAQDEPALVAAFLAPLGQLLPCSHAVVAVFDADEGGPLRLYSRGPGAIIDRHEAASATAAERMELAATPPLALRPRAELPELARRLAPTESDLLVAPLAVEGKLLGLFLAAPDAAPDAREGALYVGQLCLQLAAALRGAGLRRQNERLQRFDPLTGLPNRRSFDEHVASALAAAPRGRLLAIALVGVEGLDRIRSTFGPEDGDRILRRVGQTLREAQGVAAARLEGAEFALVAEGSTPESVGRELRRVVAAVWADMEGDDRAHALGLRAGAAVFPLDAADAPTLLRHARTALGHTASQGARGVAFFAGEMNEALERRVRLESELARAVEAEEFRLHYQPIVDARTGELVAAEALIRWQSPTLGLVGPAHFIPLAEERGLILAIGRWVLRRACRDLRAWRDDGLDPVRVSVNVSARQLEAGTLLPEVLGALTAARISPALLGLELTESTLLRDDLGAVETLRAIHRAGIALAIDDFGTGYSSLGYLTRFPVDALKLDRVFVKGVADEPDKRAITDAVLAIARELGLRVVAEGVETEAQARYLADRGCALLQGFLYGAPMAEDEFRKRLAESAA